MLLELTVQDRVLDIYLDCEGMHELDMLVNKTKLAPLIKNVTLGLRRVAHVPIVLQKMFAPNQARTARQIRISDLRSVAALFEKVIATPGFRWSWKSTKDLLHELGYTMLMDRVPRGCQMLERGKDYTPGDEIIEKLIEHIKQLPNIHSICSNEDVKHWMLLVQDKSGIETVRKVIKDREGSIVQMQMPASCACFMRGDRGMPFCKNVSTMSQFLLGDLSRIKSGLMSGVDLVNIPLWTSLNRFSLNFLNVEPHQCRIVTPEHHDLSVFLFRCRKLTHLRLSTTPEQNKYTAAAEPITHVLKRLYDHAWKARLQSLELSCVNPVDLRVVKFLESHEKTLSHLYIKNATPQPVGTTKAARLRLWHTMQRMTGLNGNIRNYAYAHWRAVPIFSERMPSDVIDASLMPSVLVRIIQSVKNE